MNFLALFTHVQPSVIPHCVLRCTLISLGGKSKHFSVACHKYQFMCWLNIERDVKLVINFESQAVRAIKSDKNGNDTAEYVASSSPQLW